MDAAPVFLASELRAKNSALFSALIDEGVLRVTTKAERIRRPDRYGIGPDLVVHSTALGLFGMPDDDDYGEPLALEEADVQRVALSFPALCRTMRKENSLGGGSAASAALECVGRKSISGLGYVEVWLTVAIGDPSRLLDVALQIRERSKVAKLLLLHSVPHLAPPPVLPEGVTAVPLTDLLSGAGFFIDWELVRTLLGRSEPDELVIERHANVWRILHFEHEAFVPDQVGMVYLDFLVARPGETIHAVDLANSVYPKNAPKYRRGEAEDEGDSPEAVSLLKSARTDAVEDLATAEQEGDTELAEELRDKIEKIDDRLRKSRGLRGRKKESGDNKNARTAVSNAITRVYSDLAERFPAIEKHLRGCISLGVELVYVPSALSVGTPRLHDA